MDLRLYRLVFHVLRLYVNAYAQNEQCMVLCLLFSEWFIHADDLMMPQHLKRILALMVIRMVIQRLIMSKSRIKSLYVR